MTATTTPNLTDDSLKGHRFEGFPVGYYDLHPDVSVNYNLNRFCTGEIDMIDAIRSVGPKIRDYRDLTRELLALGEAALKRGERLQSAYFLRSAQFYMFADDPRKQDTRRQFLQLIREHYGFADTGHFEVPYETGALSAYRWAPPVDSRGAVVLFGGFDSYVEEMFPMQRYLADAGYDVVSFDGPGQGVSLEDHGLPLTPDWHEPIGAVLDHFGLDDVTIVGMSMGGCLAVRAAAYEPRVRRVVCNDCATDCIDITFRQMTDAQHKELSALLEVDADHVIDGVFRRAMKKSLVVEWGVQQGMLVSGTDSPSAWLHSLAPYRTDDVSPLLEQDVLLLGGSEDHFVPRHQFYDQIGTLTNARSVTARLFTRHEQAHEHCQVGNSGLQFRVIKDWLEELRERDA